MTCSFDSVRRKMVFGFNRLLKLGPFTQEQKNELDFMRNQIVGLICMYDPANQPDDCNDLSHIDVDSVPGKEDGV